MSMSELANVTEEPSLILDCSFLSPAIPWQKEGDKVGGKEASQRFLRVPIMLFNISDNK